MTKFLKFLPFFPICCLLLLPQIIVATEFKSGGNIVIPESTLIQDDYFVAGDNIKFSGIVEGDLISGCQTLTSKGTVEGNLMAAAKELDISGEVGGSFRGFAQNISLDGKLKRNFLGFAQSINLKEGSVIGGDIIAYCNELKISGEIGRGVRTGACCVVISGIINGDVFVKADEITVLPDAKIYGDLIEKAKTETNPEQKTKQFIMAERILQYSARSFMKARHGEKTEQVQQLINQIKEEKELAVMLNEILQAPSIVSSTQSFALPPATEEVAVGLERFDTTNIQAKIITPLHQIGLNEDFNLDIHIANMGKEAVLLSQIRQILPPQFELIAKPELYHQENSHIALEGKRLDPLKTEKITLVVRSADQGAFTVAPTISYLDESGHQPEQEEPGYCQVMRADGFPVWRQPDRKVPPDHIAPACLY